MTHVKVHTSEVAYVSIGNSDDHLSQSEWAEFCKRFLEDCQIHAKQVYGVWYSLPDSPFQNMCVGAEWLYPDDFKERLRSLAFRFKQDSIAYAPVILTEFVSSRFSSPERTEKP